MAFNYTRYGSYIGSTVNLKVGASTKTGVHEHNAYIPALFLMDRLRFTSSIEGLYGPNLATARVGINLSVDGVQSAITDTSWKFYLSNFNVINDGIMQFTIPETTTYIIRAEGAGHSNDTSGNTHGGGARIQASFNLEMGKFLWILVGQTNVQPATNRQFAGGAGGSFVTYGDVFASSVPLVIAGGGGFLRTGSASSTNNGKIPNDHINGQTSTQSGEGTTNNSSNFGQNGIGGHNQSTGGTAAGFNEDGTAHTDLRSVPTSFTHNNGGGATTYNYGGSYDVAKKFHNGGAGGQFRTGFDTNYIGDGGFGGGGPGGWGGEGGGGGYSGGGNGYNNNSSFSGGGGSFISENIANSSDLATSTGTWTRVGTASDHGDYTPLASASGLTNFGNYKTGNGQVSIIKA
tara:strand:- start:232 stop:1440 length:1209 start_codon:yes stop_codon:yes gene_type:complete